MTEPTEALIGDFVAWLASGPRPYAEVMEVWRTSCPRLTVWEDAVDRGLVARRHDGDGRVCVGLTEVGQALLDSRAG
ncbi:MAG TPA: hypothetical protein VFC47_14140 [Caulobacteraceae bacterium]|nr:hypothetical protein [Caulobacteraceae bacterium]